MSLFSFSDILHLELEIELPETEKNYVKKMLDETPLTSLKTAEIKERRDMIVDIIENFPRYEISGQKIEVNFYENRINFIIGESFSPFLRKNKRGKTFVTIEQLDKYDTDINYLIGVIFKVTNKSYKDAKIESNIMLFKKKYKLSYDKIINKSCLSEFNKDASIEDFTLKINNNTKLSIKYDDKNNVTNINFNKIITLNGPINTVKLLDDGIAELNDILLKL
jgi:hypothetical protein